MPYANNKDADQPVHLWSLISIFIVRCFDSIMPLATFYIRNFKLLASFCSYQAGLCPTWSQTPKDSFSRDVAHFIYAKIMGNYLNLDLVNINTRANFG